MVKKEQASVAVRVHPSTRKWLKIEAAKRGVTIAEIIHELMNS